MRQPRMILIAASLLLIACGGATTAAARPTPTPVQPAQATIGAQVTFDRFRNAQGDLLMAINVHVVTDIPTPVRIHVNLTPPDPVREDALCVRVGNCPVVHGGNAYQACTPDGCLVKHGQGLADFWCSNACLAGPYKVTLDVCSYAEDQNGLGASFIRCNKQEAGYLAWVGKWGVKLAGNPLAVVDPDHSSILNLRREITITN